jgi:hypothetical protein
MTMCDYCHQESKLIFTCPQCGSHYCKDHRKPENHECASLRYNKILFEESNKIDHLNTGAAQETSDLGIKNESDFISDEVLSFDQENLEMDQEILLYSDDKKDIDLTVKEQEILETKDLEEKDETLIDTPNKAPLSNVIRREAFLVIMLLFGIILGQMLTTVIDPNEYDENLQQRYDRIYEYYMETQASNVELNVIIDDMTSDLVSVENQLNLIMIEYNQLLDQYQSLQSD